MTFESHAEKRPEPIVERNGSVRGGAGVDLIPVIFASVNENAIQGIRRAQGVAHVSQDVNVSTVDETVPWGVSRIGGRSAANQTDTSAVDIAVVDTGVDADHPDLDESLTWGVNTVGDDAFVEGLNAADDGSGHGTHVAGTAAADNDSQGVVGVAPSAGLYAMKALDDEGAGRLSDIIEAIDASVKGPDGTVGTTDDADVVSMSFGADSGAPALRDAVDAASEHSVLVAAAGNAGDDDTETNEVLYPAKYDSVVAVAATGSNDETAAWSSEGEEVELAAPGVDVLSTYLDGAHARGSGTSMAAPHVSGTAALIIAGDLADGKRDLTPTAVRQRMHDTAVDIEADGIDRRSGYGLIDADAAVESVNPPSITVVEPDDGANISGTTTVEVSASDFEDSVDELAVSIAIDNGTWQAAAYNETTGTFQFEWNTNAVEDGPHTVTAAVVDSGGTVRSVAVDVLVDNQESSPAVRFVNPVEGDDVAGTELIRVAASDDRTPTESIAVAYRLDDSEWRSLTYDSETGEFTGTWNASSVALGTHTLTARATDEENFTAETAITVEVVNETNETAGQRLSAVAAFVHEQLETEIEGREFGLRIAQAATANARAEIVSAKLESVRATLANRSDDRVRTGDGRPAQVRRAVEAARAARLIDIAAAAAADIPSAIRQRAGIDGIEALRREAQQVRPTSPAVGDGRGWMPERSPPGPPPSARSRGSGSRGSVPDEGGPPDKTGGSDQGDSTGPPADPGRSDEGGSGKPPDDAGRSKDGSPGNSAGGPSDGDTTGPPSDRGHGNGGSDPGPPDQPGPP